MTTVSAGGRGVLAADLDLSAGVLPDRHGRPLPLAELQAAWPLGTWHEATPLVGGKNEHVRLRTDAGTVWLRRSHREKDRDELRAQLALVRRLRAGGLPAPEAVPTRDGEDHAEVEGRLYTVTRQVDGEPYDDRSPRHAVELGRTVGTFHRLVADLPVPPGEPEVVAELGRRAALPGDAGLGERADEVARRLRRLLPHLPRSLVHGGARRGSLLFHGDRVAGVLDFDSAHADVRVLDLAVAAHDVGKVYTELGAADHKVALDVARVRRVVGGYLEAGGDLLAAEAEAAPLLVEAKRLKRCLGRVQRRHRGEPLSAGDLAKIELELARLHWLAEHRDELADALSAGGAVPAA